MISELLNNQVSYFFLLFFSDDKEPETNISRKELLFLPGFLGNCCCYLGTALVQHGVLQWSQLFIVQEKHQSVLTGTYMYVLQCNKCSERICFLMSLILAI